MKLLDGIHTEVKTLAKIHMLNKEHDNNDWFCLLHVMSLAFTHKQLHYLILVLSVVQCFASPLRLKQVV